MKFNLTFSDTFDELYNEYLEEAPELLALEGIDPDHLDVGFMSHKYFTDEACNFTVDNNANGNEDNCYNNYHSEIVAGLHKLEGYYLLHRYAEKKYGTDYANQLMESIWLGDLYFHDPTKIQIPYCWAYSTSFIMLEGRPYGQLRSVPPKRSDSFVAEVIETTMDLSQEFAGAIAMGDFIVNLCYYLRKEGMGFYSSIRGGIYVFYDEEKDYIINQFQKLVHVMNNKFRISGESPFTNISIFDRSKLEHLFKDYMYPDGTGVDFDYVLAVQDLFMEFFSVGHDGEPYRFPVVTINMSKDENDEPLDKEFAMKVAHYNSPLAAFNIYPTGGTKLAMCCRFVNDAERMDARQDSFGNGGLNIGSHRVVTVNLPRIALIAANDGDVYGVDAEELFFKHLDDQLQKAKDLLLIHREEILQRRIDRGFLKFFDPKQVGWFNLDSMFSTIGIVGVYEMCKYMGYDILAEEGTNFVAKVLKYIDDKALQFSKETGYSFNTEEIPAEGTAPKIAAKDNFLLGTNCPMYSNQYLPVAMETPYMTRINLTGKFMKLVSGGGILHLNVKEKIDSDEKMYRLMVNCMKAGVEHFAINYGYNKCENGHITVGGNDLEICPHCGAPITDVLTRVIGYHSWVSKWSQTRKEEFKHRDFKEI